jgi:hypothetical protein
VAAVVGHVEARGGFMPSSMASGDGLGVWKWIQQGPPIGAKINRAERGWRG